MLRSTDARRAYPAALIAIAVAVVSSSARAVSVAPQCASMPPELAAELEQRVTAALAGTAISSAALRIDCDPNAVWLLWPDGTRAPIDLTRGVVEGVVTLVAARVAWDRGHPPPPDDGRATARAERPPEEPEARAEPSPSRRSRTEGGVGFALASELWSGASAMGPRLDVAIAPPGPVSILIGEGMLFGLGSSGSSQVTMFDLQAGAALGAPFNGRRGFGSVLLLGAERISASNAASDVSGLWEWTFLVNLGLRASVKVQSTNLWLGADVALRSDDFKTGGSSPVSVPAASFLLSAGCFFPALVRSSPRD
jgi:hypothetical protein